MIALEHVTKSFGDDAPAVDDVSLTVSPGEFLVLLGSSGSGKSTTLKLINRLIDPDAGRIILDGSPVDELDPIKLRQSIGYVIQEIGLLPHWTVSENISSVLRLQGIPRPEREATATGLLEALQLDPDFADRYPHELSGGQQQRVGVARALAADPEYLLMDEPFGALDGVTRESLQQILLDLKETLTKTIVFVTHDLFEALTLADRIGVMHKGRLEQIGSPKELLESPATPFVRDLFAKPARHLQTYQDHLT